MSTIRSTKYVLSYVLRYRNGKIYAALKGVLAILSSLLPIVFTVFPGMILNELVGDVNIRNLVFYVLMLTTIPAVYGVFEKYINCYLWKINNALRIGI